MDTTDISPNPSQLLLDAQRLVRQAGGLSVMLLGIVCAGASALIYHEERLHAEFLLVVYLVAPICIRRWRARHGQPDIRTSIAISEGSWWRWKGFNKESVWHVRPLIGILILAAALLIKTLLEYILDGPRGASGDWIVAAIACNYLLIFRSLKMTEDLVMGVGLGLLTLAVMSLPSATVDTTVRWCWIGIGLLMIITGASRHLRWQRWVAAHRSEIA